MLCIILCLALGISNIFTTHPWHILFAVLCMLVYSCPLKAMTLTPSSVSAPIILFVEVPFLLRICPTSGRFDEFIRRITTNWMRATMYVCLSAIQWVSLVGGASSLIAAAVFLLIAALCYALAGLKSQEFVGSKTLGGQGIAQMIV